MDFLSPQRPTNFYAGGTLDRAAHRRQDQDWLAAVLASGEARYTIAWQGQALVSGSEEAPRAVLLAQAAAEWQALSKDPPVFLGLLGGQPLFAYDIDPAIAADELPFLLPHQARFAPLRQIGPLLAADDGNMLIAARGLLNWQERTRFCALCGHGLAAEAAGHVRRCLNSDCATPHFPRSDPAVIMLVTDGERALLGRQAAWAPGLHSVLAGFVEPGESLEQAVAREVEEETGIKVGNIRYHSSQPWPFPASLMLGFYAQAAGGALAVNQDELESAAWFDRGFLREALRQGASLAAENNGFQLPRPDSLSRRLLEDWLAAS